MDLKKLLGLRPKERTAASIQDAILRTVESKEAAQVRVAELEAGRGILLLQGDPKAIEAAERELVEARAEIERCNALAVAMNQSLEDAGRAEKAREIGTAHDDAVRQVAAFVEWWRTEYPTLAQKMRAGAMMERQALAAISEMHRLSVAHPEAFTTSGARIPANPAEHLYPGDTSNGVIGVTAGLHLPPPEGKAWPNGNAQPFWPPEHSIIGGDR